MVICGREIHALNLTAHTVNYGYCVDITIAFSFKRLRVQGALLSKVVTVEAVTDGRSSRACNRHHSGKSINSLIGNLRLSYSFF